MPDSTSPQEVRLSRLQFRLYLSALIIVTAAFSARAVLQRVAGQADPYDQAIIPFISVWFAASVAAYLRLRSIRWIAISGYYVTCALILGRFAYLYLGFSSEPPLDVLPRFSHWLPALFSLGHVAFETRRAFRMNLAYYAVLTAFGFGRGISEYVRGAGVGELQAIVHMAGADATLILLIYGFARMKEQYDLARAREATYERAKQAAEAASAAKSEFLSRVSHELRTPLNSVLGFGQLLAMQELTPRQRQGVDQILRGGRHLLELINEVLDISRIESGQLTLSVEPVTVRAVVDEVVDLVGPIASPREIAVVCGDVDGSVMADRQRLKQVLLNLVANAVKYNRDGGWVKITLEPSSGERLRIVVADNGPGLAADHVARLFRPFDRLGAERSNVEGTGLGLTLSKGITEAMHGQLGVASELGAGSRFWIELPGAAQPSAPRRDERPVGPSREFGDELPAAATVLYVEDNPANVQVVEWALDGRHGVKLLAAMQGRLGLELARRHRPKVILLDLHLPDMSGHDVLEALRADPTTSGIPVIVLSADATASQIARLKAAGAHDYLTKPVDVARLQAVVDGFVAETVLSRA